MPLFRRNVYNQDYSKTFRLTQLAAFLSAFSIAASAHAATYYIAPNGSDGGAGTNTAPWKTFAFAIPKLNPGDTLLLKDGTYTGGTTGMINVNCSSGARRGTASAPITIRAENERQAFFQSDGLTAIAAMEKCSYWVVQGITGKGMDNPNVGKSIGRSQGVNLKYCDHITVRRNLFSTDNRYANGGFLSLFYTNNSLVEENEVYDFHRHAGGFKHGDGNVFRRNYSNSRGRKDIPGGYGPTDPPDMGETLATIYPGSGNILENNIAEWQSSVTDIQSIDKSENNREYGDITLHTNSHTILARRVRENPNGPGSVNYYMENVVSVEPNSVAVNSRGATNTVVNHVSIFGAGKKRVSSAISADQGGLTVNGVPRPRSPLALSINVKNSIITEASGYATYFVDQNGGFSVDHTNLFNNAKDFYPSSSPTYTNNLSKDPGLGSCKVFIPDNSPMKGAGTDGEDIGANIVCRYENGVLQVGNPLWDPATGAFPCGAIYHGINDKPGESCFDVHKRLNVNANGCTLPPASSCKPVKQPNFPPVVGAGAGGAPVFYSPDGKVCPSGYN